MSTPHPFLTELLQQLPAVWHDPVTALADATLQTANPLRLILVGAFSVGKSSLLNMLLPALHFGVAVVARPVTRFEPEEAYRDFFETNDIYEAKDFAMRLAFDETNLVCVRDERRDEIVRDFDAEVYR